jgi:hypothetical protein
MKPSGGVPTSSEIDAAALLIRCIWAALESTALNVVRSPSIRRVPVRWELNLIPPQVLPDRAVVGPRGGQRVQRRRGQWGVILGPILVAEVGH